MKYVLRMTEQREIDRDNDDQALEEGINQATIRGRNVHVTRKRKLRKDVFTEESVGDCSPIPFSKRSSA